MAVPVTVSAAFWLCCVGMALSAIIRAIRGLFPLRAIVFSPGRAERFLQFVILTRS